MEDDPNVTGVDVSPTEPKSADDGEAWDGGEPSDCVEDRPSSDPPGGYDREGGSVDLRRRGFLGVAGGVALGAAMPTTSAAEEESGDGSTSTDGRRWIVRQRDDCHEVEPLDGDEPAAEFYDLDRDTIGERPRPMRSLQERETSILFLYRDPAGDVYLVAVHGKQEPREDADEGGSATFTFHGLPDGGEWVVRDDSYDGPTRFDRWHIDGEPQAVDWTWQPGWKDGAVYGPLGEDVAISIQPRFNEEAELYEEHYEGEVDAWTFLSGSLPKPDRSPLDMDEPVEIRTGQCRDERSGASEDERGANTPDDEPRSDSPLEVSVSCDVDDAARVQITNVGDETIEARDIDDEGMDVIDGRPELGPEETLTLSGIDDGSFVVQAFEPGVEYGNVGPKIEVAVDCG